MHGTNERGIALLTTLLVMMLMSALLVGFTAVVMSDQRYRFIDRDRNQAFYAAAGGIEKMTADLGNLFLGHVAPTAAQLTALTVPSAKPTIGGVTFTASMAAQTLPTSSLTRCASPNALASVGTSGYTISFCASPGGNPATTSTSPIKTGPYEGLIAQQMPYQFDVSAKTATGGEAHLVRTAEAVAIPVFQFGIFSDVDLSFFAGPVFNFGGRVHTNGNLFLASGSTLTLSDKVTALKEVVRQRLQNNISIDTAPHTGTVNVAKAPASYDALLRTEGSVQDGVGSPVNEPTWYSTSVTKFNTWIRNSRTGAKKLDLALVTAGGTNNDLIRRPLANEHIDNPALFSERLFGKASLRILLSDLAPDLTGMPGVTATPPVNLGTAWRTTVPNNGIAPYGPIDLAHPPIARSEGLTTGIITVNRTAGTNRILTVGAGVPAYFKVPATITVNKLAAPAATYTLTCTGAGDGTSAANTTFTGCTTTTGNPLVSWLTLPTPTVTANVVTADGLITVSTTLAANWPATAAPVFPALITAPSNVQVANTMAFAPHSFFVDNNVVTCFGYTATTFLNCTLSADITAPATLTTAAHSTVGTGTIGGFLKVERQATDGSWNDVTMEILNWGMAGSNLSGFSCGDPTPNAILRLQRRKDNNWASCPPSSNVSPDFQPNVLFDTREALVRDVSPGANVFPLGGVMHYVTIDVANLTQWFRGTGVYGGSTGVNSKLDNGGYTVYFSDRRNNRNATSNETGEYGFEDFVNPAIASGAPNGALDAGEDVNANAALDVYGQVPNYNGFYNTVPPAVTPGPFTIAARPATTLTRGQAQVNRAILFRRALKLTNGSNIAGSGVTGLSVVSENPVYVQGDWNATGATFAGVHAATSVMADAVTLLSNNWNDTISFTQPYSPGSRPRLTQTWYRLAIISGKGGSFPQPAGTATDFGTDGGAHNFLRYLEDGDQPLNYRGSMATFYYNRQALGTYKCCTTVYSPPTRNYTFDSDFLTPALLPPNTPMFRDLNTVGFAQEMRPGR